MKLSRNMLALLALGWVLLTGWLAWWQYQSQTQALIREKTIAGKNAVTELARRLQNALHFYHRVPLMLAEDPLVLAALTGGDCPARNSIAIPGTTATNAPGQSALDNLNLLLHRVQSTLGPSRVFVLDAGGLCVAASDYGRTNSAVGENVAAQEYFRQARESGQGRQFAIGRHAHKPGLFFATRVMQADHFVGEVAVKLNLDRLDDCLDPPDAFLADAYGVVILANNPALLMTELPSAPVEQLSEPSRLKHYQLSHFPTLALTPWSNPNPAPLFQFNHEAPPQLLFSRAVLPEGLRVYVPEPLPELLTLPRDYLAGFTLLAVAGGSLILFLGAGFNYRHDQPLSNRRTPGQTKSLVAPEPQLFNSRETLMMILNHIPQRVYWKNRDLVFEGCNLSFARDCGLADPSEVIGKTDFALTNAAEAEKYQAMDREVMELDRPKLNFEMIHARPDRRPAYLLVNKLPLHDPAGRVIGVLGAFDDITEHKLMEFQFRQAQKMEAIGRLAGGIAHDFNNLLTVICGYSEILLHELPAEDSSRDALTEIRKAGDRAASLTRKLLAFSRKQVLEPDVLDLNALVADCENMFRRLLGEHIILTVNLAPGLCKIKADASQIDQVLLNLVVNARDAMPRGGRLVITTARALLTEADRLPDGSLTPGKYISLSVSDTGCGMDDFTILHIFEPFFTTKEQGKGTGLGLAMIFGFIKQSGGHISAASEVGRGSVFHIYLPELVEPPE